MKHCSNCYVENVPLFIATCAPCYESDPEESVQCQSCIDARRRVNNHLVCVRCDRPTKVRRTFGWNNKLTTMYTHLATAMTPHDEQPERLDFLYVFACAVMIFMVKYAIVSYFQQSLFLIAISIFAQCVAMTVHVVSCIRHIHYRINTSSVWKIKNETFLREIIMIRGFI
jgi:hypothetical protein